MSAHLEITSHGAETLLQQNVTSGGFQSYLAIMFSARTYQFPIQLKYSFFWSTEVLFAGPLIPLFWTSGHVCPGFQSQGGFSHLCALLPTHNGFLRFTSGMTPADLLAASMVPQLFHPHTFTCVQALVGLESRIKHAIA